MKTWFTSLNGAITMSAVALVLFILRTFLDFQFVMPEFAPSGGPVVLSLVIYAVLVGGWLWALLAAARGSQGGLIGLLVASLVLAFGLGVATLISFCPSPCATAGGQMEIANWSNLVTGGLSAIAVGLHLRQGRARGVSP